MVQFTCTSEQQVSLFDIINNRGEPFDMPDMVRLMLFSHTNKTQHKELNRIWTESKVEHNLLSWVWNAFYADPNNIARNKLQFQIEQELDKQTPSQASQWAIEFATRCNECSKAFSSISSFNESHFSDKNFYKVAFLTSNDYEKFSRPIFFALENITVPEDEKQKIYRYLLNFIVRVTITRDPKSKTVGNILPKLAVSICQIIRTTYDGGSSILDKIKSEIKSSPIFETVADDNFVDKFRNYTLGSNSARFGYLIIGSIENAKSGNKSATDLTYYSNDESNQSNNLEHIFPQSPNVEQWPEAGCENISEYIGKIGNLLPINKRANSAIKNSGITDKIRAYKGQNLAMWPDLSKAINKSEIGHPSPSWTIKKIKERTAQLADEARDIFSLD